MNVQSVTLAGKRFVIMAEDDYKRMSELALKSSEESLPEFPAPDAKGRYPAKEAIDVSIAREFIQRRGRILRKSPGKEHSVIHDLVAVPPDAWNASQTSPTFQIERSIVRRELQRFKEFAGPALNKHQALDAVWDIARSYGLMDI